MVAREGSRPMLIEVQALTDEAQGMNPRRVAVGLESNRLALLLAVLHRHGGVSSAGRDVFLNVVGGVRISETAQICPQCLRRSRAFATSRCAARSSVSANLGSPAKFGRALWRRATARGREARLRARDRAGCEQASSSDRRSRSDRRRALARCATQRLSKSVAALAHDRLHPRGFDRVVGDLQYFD